MASEAPIKKSRLRKLTHWLLHGFRPHPDTARRIEQPAHAEARLLPDQPLQAKSDDRFGRWQFASRIADTIASRRSTSSIVLGLFGSWGDGKTTVLNFVRSRLTEIGNVIIVDFNPWMFHSEQQLVTMFFEALAAKLDYRLTTRRERLGAILRDYGCAVGSCVNAGQALETIGRRWSDVPLERLRDRLRSALLEFGRPIAVLIDDIDRLSHSETIAVFRLVKLLADFPLVSYVVSFDPEIVARALSETLGGNLNSGAAYLEKIVQVPLHLPRAEQDVIARLALELIDRAVGKFVQDIPHAEIQRFQAAFGRHIAPQLRNVRLVNRWVNALEFVCPILQGEANVIDLVLVEAIRVLYPKLYQTVRIAKPEVLGVGLFRQDPTAAERRAGEIRAALQPVLSDLSETGCKSAQGLLTTLFPQLDLVWRNTHHGGQDAWVRAKRACTELYFDRYFSYGIPVGDVADGEVSGFLAGLCSKSMGESASCLRGLFERATGDTLTYKLRLVEDSLPESEAARLVLAYGQVSEVIPEPAQLFGELLSPRAQIRISIVVLLSKIQDRSVRLNTAEELVRSAVQLSFAVACFDEIAGTLDPRSGVVLFEESEVQRLGGALANRVNGEATRISLLDQYGRDAISLYRIWIHYGDAAKARADLHGALHGSPTRALHAVRACMGQSFSGETGLPMRPSISAAAYDYLEELVGPGIIHDALVREYGEPSCEPYEFPNDELPEDLDLACRYIFFHRARSTEGSDPKSAGDGAGGDGQSHEGEVPTPGD